MSEASGLIQAHRQLLSHVRRDDDAWRLASLDVIYEKDMLAHVNPSDRLEIDRAELSGYRPSYRFLCYTLHRVGRPINPNLPGDDRPDLIEALYAEAEGWLMESVR